MGCIARAFARTDTAARAPRRFLQARAGGRLHAPDVASRRADARCGAAARARPQAPATATASGRDRRFRQCRPPADACSQAGTAIGVLLRVDRCRLILLQASVLKSCLVALAVGVVAWTVARAFRPSSSPMRSVRDNCRQVVASLASYMRDHGAAPPSLDALVHAEELPPKLVAVRGASSVPSPHLLYLRPAGPEAAADVPVIVSNPACLANGCSVLVTARGVAYRLGPAEAAAAWRIAVPLSSSATALRQGLSVAHCAQLLAAAEIPPPPPVPAPETPGRSPSSP